MLSAVHDAPEVCRGDSSLETAGLSALNVEMNDFFDCYDYFLPVMHIMAALLCHQCVCDLK